MLVPGEPDGKEVSRNRGKPRMVARLPQGPEEVAEPERDQQVVGAPTLGDNSGAHQGEIFVLWSLVRN